MGFLSIPTAILHNHLKSIQCMSVLDWIGHGLKHTDKKNAWAPVLAVRPSHDTLGST